MAPWNPPQPQDPLEMLFKLQALKQSQDQRDLDEQHDIFKTGLEILKAGGDPTEVLQTLRDRSVSNAMGGLYQQQKREVGQEKYRQFVSSPNFGQAATGIAPIQGTGNALVPPSPEAEQATIDALTNSARQMDVPEDKIPALVQQVRANAAAIAAERQSVVNADQRNANQQSQFQSQGAEIAKAAAEKQDERKLAEEKRRYDDASVTALATRKASYGLGYVPVGEIPDVSGDIVKQYGPRAPEIMARVDQEALAQMAGFEIQIGLKEAANTKNVRAAAEGLGVSETVARNIFVNEISIIDPARSGPDGKPSILAVAKGQGPKITESRRALVDTLVLLRDMERSFDNARRANASGPILGEDTPQGMFRALGAQHPAAAEYDVKRKAAIRAMMMASKESRASDQDTRFFGAMFPTLSELYSGSAEGRFKALEDLVRLQIEAPYNQEIGKLIRDRKEAYTVEDRRMERAMEDYGEGKIEMKEFEDAMSSWKRSRGGKFVLPGVGSGPASPGAQNADEEAKTFGIGE